MMSRDTRRRVLSGVMTGLAVGSVLVALVPLAFVLFFVVSQGVQALSLDFFTQTPSPVGEDGGGMGPAILGTLILIGIGALIAIPIGIMSGVFVMETVTVILQVGSFKLRGKRIFKMAPIHHHFELKGWPEPRVIVRFWIITVMLVLIGLATLKLR